MCVVFQQINLIYLVGGSDFVSPNNKTRTLHHSQLRVQTDNKNKGIISEMHTCTLC